MVKKLVGKAAGAAGTAAKAATQTAKRQVIDEVTKPVKKAAKDTFSTLASGIKAKAEEKGSADFSSLWSGQAASLGAEINSADLTRHLMIDAKRCLNATSL